MTRRGALAVMALLCSLAACEDEPTPDIPDPTPSSTSPSVSESASPTTPTETPEVLSPEETVRAWIGAWNAALASGDTSGLAPFQTPDCRNCDNLSKVIDDVASAGGSFTGGTWSIVSSDLTRPEPDRVKMSVAMEVAAGSTVNAAGKEPVEYPADKRIVVYELRDESGTWLIDVIELLS